MIPVNPCHPSGAIRNPVGTYLSNLLTSLRVKKQTHYRIHLPFLKSKFFNYITQSVQPCGEASGRWRGLGWSPQSGGAARLLEFAVLCLLSLSALSSISSRSRTHRFHHIHPIVKKMDDGNSPDSLLFRYCRESHQPTKKSERVFWSNE